MRIGRLWDYLMRRKLMFFGVISLLTIGMTFGIKICDNLLSTNTFNNKNQEMNAAATYDNNLIFKITGKSGEASYTLAFAQKFQQAQVSLSDEPLAGEAYVRIFDNTGRLLVGEYTTMRDLATEVGELLTDEMIEEATEDESETEIDEAEPEIPVVTEVEYSFIDAPKSYTLDLAPGYIIEVRGQTAQFYSTLDGKVATSFTPNPTLERYVVMENGLRKEAWSELEGRQAMSEILQSYLCSVIENYQATVPEEVLNNKKLDTAAKSKVLLAYHSLTSEAQAPYAEFIAHLQRGGMPVITYLGETKYKIGTELDLLALVELFDNEDGELSKDSLSVTANLQTNVTGEYEIVYTVRDSDENETVLRVMLEIFDPKASEIVRPGETIDKVEPGLVEEESREPATNVTAPNDPAQSTVGNTTDTVGGGVNLGEEIAVVDEIIEEIEEVKTAPLLETKSSTEPKATNEAKAEKSGITIWTAIWFAVGIVVLLLLIRFIFDHYVR